MKTGSRENSITKSKSINKFLKKLFQSSGFFLKVCRYKCKVNSTALCIYKWKSISFNCRCLSYKSMYKISYIKMLTDWTLLPNRSRVDGFLCSLENCCLSFRMLSIFEISSIEGSLLLPKRNLRDGDLIGFWFISPIQVLFLILSNSFKVLGFVRPNLNLREGDRIAFLSYISFSGIKSSIDEGIK